MIWTLQSETGRLTDVLLCRPDNYAWIPTNAIARATLTKKHIAGDYDGAASEFARWNRAGGRMLKGLVRRRAAEAELYQSRPSH